jgi:hypothetical protein
MLNQLSFKELEYIMGMSREEEALSAYVKLLTTKGLNQRALIQREFIVIRFSAYLDGIEGDGAHYRQAVDKFLASIDQEEVDTVLPVVREFYSFWVKDIKAIAAMNQGQIFSPKSESNEATTRELIAKWNLIDQLSMKKVEHQLLDAYTNAIHQRGIAGEALTLRRKIAKFIMLALRDEPNKQPLVYRNMVDAHMPLFMLTQAQHAYLSVAREFYTYWNGDVPAKAKVEAKDIAIAA